MIHSVATIEKVEQSSIKMLLMMIGKERIYGVLTIALALLTGIGCYALALRFGGAGAAVATSVGLAVTNALCLFVFYTTIVNKTRAPAELAGP